METNEMLGSAAMGNSPADENRESQGAKRKCGRRSREEILREKAEKENAEWGKLPLCERQDCHAWQDGRCIALSDNGFGDRDCPFYKKLDVCQRERRDAYEKLIKSGRMKLAGKYEPVLAELGMFDLADGFTDRAAAELERYSEECLQELLRKADEPDEPEETAGFDTLAGFDEPVALGGLDTLDRSAPSGGLDTPGEEADWDD